LEGKKPLSDPMPLVLSGNRIASSASKASALMQPNGKEMLAATSEMKSRDSRDLGKKTEPQTGPYPQIKRKGRIREKKLKKHYRQTKRNPKSKPEYLQSVISRDRGF